MAIKNNIVQAPVTWDQSTAPEVRPKQCRSTIVYGEGYGGFERNQRGRFEAKRRLKYLLIKNRQALTAAAPAEVQVKQWWLERNDTNDSD